MTTRTAYWWQLPIAVFVIGMAAPAAHADERRKGGVPPPDVWFSEIAGHYAFPGKRWLTVTGSAYKIRAQLDGHPEVLLVRAGGGVLKAADGSFTLTFRQHENGSVTDVELEETAGRETAPAGAGSRSLSISR